MLTEQQAVTGRKALVLDIQRMSTEDGPGLRTTVFLKGCTLSCSWCHNPESIHSYKEIQWMDTKCIGCRSCVNTCPHRALALTDQGLVINRKNCDRCLLCAKACPSTSIEVKGQEWTVEKLVNEVAKDRVYFEKSGGGVSVSGGEPLCQSHFVADFFRRLKNLGLHTTLDTCGMCSEASLSMVLPYTDLVLFDLKIMDSSLHERYTGAPNAVILNNIRFLADWIREKGQPSALWIRTPVIPDATATDDNIAAIGRFIAEYLSDVIKRWDLCAFNNLCLDKYKRLDQPWAHSLTGLVKRDEMNRLAQLAKSSGVNPDIVHWSGPTRIED